MDGNVARTILSPRASSHRQRRHIADVRPVAPLVLGPDIPKSLPSGVVAVAISIWTTQCRCSRAGFVDQVRTIDPRQSRRMQRSLGIPVLQLQYPFHSASPDQIDQRLPINPCVTPTSFRFPSNHHARQTGSVGCRDIQTLRKQLHNSRRLSI